MSRLEREFPYKPFELVMLQPTSFCNINCDYCYLDANNRGQKNKMSFETLEKICERVFESSLIAQSKDITFMWHEGEPLVMPIDYYKACFNIVQKHAAKASHTKPQHSFLTNGTLVTDEWCEFFIENDCSVGVSIDGPEFIHDIHRKRRNGKGTFESVIKGVQTLKHNTIIPYFLTTVHYDTLKYPKELFEFYKEQGVKKIGFNFEEVIGYNKKSSLLLDDNLSLVNEFVNEFYELYKADKTLFVREFDNMKFIVCENVDLESASLDTIAPYSILTVNYKGDFSTFAPELIDMRDEKYQDFIFGNVFNNSIEETLSTEKLNSVLNDIKSGIKLCKETCDYFEVCGSNLPGHKLTANGTFNSTETLYCKVAIKTVATKVMHELTEELNSF